MTVLTDEVMVGELSSDVLQREPKRRFNLPNAYAAGTPYQKCWRATDALSSLIASEPQLSDGSWAYGLQGFAI